ncbi:MAG TPA: hypothetical protein VKE95_02680 [Burkholderiales bacterium]|nr:hypothetical protein [Burkholderiales bacterium]
MSFLQRVAVAAASPRPGGTVQAAAGPLTLGRLVRRRAMRRARFQPAGAPVAAPQEWNPAALAEEETVLAQATPGAPSISGPRETGRTREGLAVPSVRPPPAADDAHAVHERIESAGAPAAAPLVPETTAKEVFGRPLVPGALADAAARGADRAAAGLSSGATQAPAVLRRRLQRDADETTAHDEEEPEKELPAVQRASADAAASESSGDQKEEEEEQPSVQRAFLASAALAPAPATRSLSGAPLAPGVGLGSPAPWAGPGAPAPQADAPASEPQQVADAAAPSGAPVAAQAAGFTSKRSGSAAPRVEARAPLPAAAAAPMPAEPVVHIGSIEIVIEAPPPESRNAGAVKPPAGDFASRHYLRGL